MLVNPRYPPRRHFLLLSATSPIDPTSPKLNHTQSLPQPCTCHPCMSLNVHHHQATACHITAQGAKTATQRMPQHPCSPSCRVTPNGKIKPRAVGRPAQPFRISLSLGSDHRSSSKQTQPQQVGTSIHYRYSVGTMWDRQFRALDKFAGNPNKNDCL